MYICKPFTFETIDYYMIIEKIISGGQTGVDRSALDFALKNNVPCGGWCPKGRKAEDGTIPENYPLEEANSRKSSKRTELNVRNSDGTIIIICKNILIEGSKLTEVFCKKFRKPFLVFDISYTRVVMKNRFDKWVAENNIKVLNVAGNKESECEGIYEKSYDILEFILGFSKDSKEE